MAESDGGSTAPMAIDVLPKKAKRVVRRPVAAPVAGLASATMTAEPAVSPAPEAVAETPMDAAAPLPEPAAPSPLPVVQAVAPLLPTPPPPLAQALIDTAAELADPIGDTASDTPPAAVPADSASKDKMMATIENTTQAAGAKASAMFEDMNVRAKGAMEKGAQMFEELNAFGKGNLEAMVESSKIAAKGFEAMGQEAAEFTRKSFEGATQQMKTLAATKSPTEFMKLQSDYFRAAFDTMVAETSRSTEMMLKLANDVAQPISSRAALAAEKMKVAA